MFADIHTKKQISEERLNFEIDVLNNEVIKNNLFNYGDGRIYRTPIILREQILDYKNNIETPKGLSLDEVLKNLKYIYDGVDFTDSDLVLDETYGFTSYLTEIIDGKRNKYYTFKGSYIDSKPIDDENTYCFYGNQTKYRIVEEITTSNNYYYWRKVDCMSFIPTPSSKETPKIRDNMKIYLIYFYENDGFHSHIRNQNNIMTLTGHGYMAFIAFLNRDASKLCCFPTVIADIDRGGVCWGSTTKEGYYEKTKATDTFRLEKLKEIFILDLKENI